MTQEEGIILERHEGRLLLLEREMKELRSVQKEIRAMNESLVVLTNELRHTNEHMKSRRKAAFLMHFCSCAEWKNSQDEAHRSLGLMAYLVYVEVMRYFSPRGFPRSGNGCRAKRCALRGTKTPQVEAEGDARADGVMNNAARKPPFGGFLSGPRGEKTAAELGARRPRR